MSDFVLRTAPSHRSSLRILSGWLRQARVAASLTNLPAVPREAHFLADVGLTADQVGRAVDRGTVEIGLLGLGWQKPGRNGRR